MKDILVQFIPIIVLFVFLSKNAEFTEFSKTSLGKLIALLIIIFYTYVDKIFGAFACAIALVYFHTLYLNNIHESMETIELSLPMNNIELEFTENNIADDYVDDYVYIEDDGKKDKLIPKPVNIISMKPLHHYLSDGTKEGEFRKKNCYDGQLTYKELKIKNEMAEHVYPEMKYKNIVCNPCSKNCEISVSKNKMVAEEKIKPTYSKMVIIS